MYPTPRCTAGTADTGFDASAAVFAAADRDIGLLVSRDPRSALVYRERTLCGRTLDRVGAAMGVTRERVRQLERSLSADLVGLRSVGRALNELKRAHAPFAPPEALTGVPRLRTFAHLAPDWSLTPGGWLVVDGADERVDAALTELSDGASPASVADLSAMLGVRRDVVAGYLECVRRMWLIDGGVLVPPRTVGARAAAILRASPGPMTIAQLSELLGDRPRSSLRNSLARTPGVRRCGADVWTLADRPGDRPVNPATPGPAVGAVAGAGRGHWSRPPLPRRRRRRPGRPRPPRPRRGFRRRPGARDHVPLHVGAGFRGAGTRGAGRRSGGPPQRRPGLPGRPRHPPFRAPPAPPEPVGSGRSGRAGV